MAVDPHWCEVRSTSPGEILGVPISNVLFFSRRAGKLTLFMDTGAAIETAGTETELDNVVAHVTGVSVLDKSWEPV